MNGKERALAALSCRPTDRLSIFPSVDVAGAAKYLGETVGTCFTDAGLQARSLEAVLDRHPDIDGVYINLCLTRRTARRCGPDRFDDEVLEWKVPHNDIGTVAVRHIQHSEAPRLLTENPLMDGVLDTFRAVQPEYRARFLILPGITGPYSHLTFLYGLENTMMLMLDEPELMHRLLRRRTELAVEWGSLLSPAMYDEFVRPYAAALMDAMRSMGVRTLMHVCGDINATAPLVAATGADGLDVDHMVSPRRTAERAGRPICVKENLDPVTLLRSAPGEVAELSCRAAASAPPHFILGTGCLIARDTPPENSDAMQTAARRGQEGAYEQDKDRMLRRLQRLGLLCRLRLPLRRRPAVGAHAPAAAGRGIQRAGGRAQRADHGV